MAGAGFLALYPSHDTGLWFHLAAGRSIAEHGLPSRETWCLAAQGQQPWLSEWLFRLALHEVHAAAGLVGVALWRAAWAAAAMALSVWILRLLGAASWTALLLSPLVLAVARDRFEPRPEQLFFVFTLLAVGVFESARRSGRDRTRWLIPAQALWANLQGSWVFGPALAWLYAAGEWWRGRRASLAEPPARPEAQPAPPPAASRARAPLWGVLGLILWGASAIVPRPLETLASPFRFLAELRASALPGAIDELRGWSWKADRFDPFTLLLGLGMVAALLGGRRVWRASPALTLFALAALGLGALGVRFRGLAAWAMLPALALALGPGGGGPMRLLRTAATLVAALGGLGWLATSRTLVPGVAPDWRAVPAGAVALAESLKLEGPMLNTYRHGGYILWARGERNPPLLDGRGRGGAAFRSQFTGALWDPLALDSLLDTWDFHYAILQPSRGTDDRMAINLSRRLEWALIFGDDAGLLFVRWSRYPEIARARAYRYFSPDYLVMMDVSQRSNTDPGLGRLLDAELERAYAASPHHARAGIWLGIRALARREPREALRYLDEAERLAPGTPDLALRQGFAREMIGDLEGARKAYLRALREPDDAPTARAQLDALDRKLRDGEGLEKKK